MRRLSEIVRYPGFLALMVVLGAAAPPAKQPPSNPVGAGWETKSTPAPNTDGAILNPTQAAAIAKVNAYFNGITYVQGSFAQKDPDKKVSKGKIYISRPGKFRFEYSRPSRKIVISDGQYLAIQDLDLKTEDTYELDNTPFRILLRKDVDLLRDAKIHDITELNGEIILTMSDKDPNVAGTITVLLKSLPTVELMGWATTDGQGLRTVVQVSDLTQPDALDDKLFVREKLFVKGLQQN